MAPENWLQRASGLVVPARSFADNPLGRWQPCEGPCCFSPVLCTDCYQGAYPAGVWADMPLLSNGTCSTCSAYNNLYYLDNNVPALPCYDNISISTWPTCGGVNSLVFFLMSVHEGKCRMDLWLSTNVSPMYYVKWELVFSSPVSTIDHTLTHVSSGADCDGTGTTVHVYE